MLATPPMPAVSSSRIQNVRTRVREGFYDRPEVLEELVDHLLTHRAAWGASPSPDRRNPTSVG